VGAKISPKKRPAWGGRGLTLFRGGRRNTKKREKRKGLPVGQQTALRQIGGTLSHRLRGMLSPRPLAAKSQVKGERRDAVHHLKTRVRATSTSTVRRDGTIFLTNGSSLGAARSARKKSADPRAMWVGRGTLINSSRGTDKTGVRLRGRKCRRWFKCVSLNRAKPGLSDR